MTASSDLDRYDGLGLAALVRQREVTAGELLDAAIARQVKDLLQQRARADAR